MNVTVVLIQKNGFDCYRYLGLTVAILAILSLFSFSALAQPLIQSEAQFAAALIESGTDDKRASLIEAYPQFITKTFRSVLAMQILRLQMKGEHERVIALNSFIRKLAESRQDTGWVAMTWVGSAGSLELTGRLKEAIAAAMRTANLKPIEHDKMAHAHVEGLQAFLAHFTEKPQFLALIRPKAENSLRNFNPEQKLEIALAHCALGLADLRVIEHDRSLTELQTSIRMFEEIGDRFWLAIPYNYLGEYFYYRGNHLLATSYLEKSVKISEEYGIRFLLYYTTNILGQAYESLADSHNALLNYEKTLKERLWSGDKRKIAIAYSSLIHPYIAQGRLEKAFEYMELFLRYAQESQDPVLVASAYRNLGFIYSYQGNRKLSIEALEKSLSIAKTIDDKSQLIVTLFHVANIYSSDEKNDKALEIYQKIELLAGSAITPTQTIGLKIGLGCLYFRMREWDKSLRYFQEVVKINEKFFRTTSLVDAYLYIGRIQSIHGDYQQALKMFQQAQSIVDKYQISTTDPERAIGRTYYALQQTDQAIEYFEKAVIRAEKSRSIYSNTEWRALHFSYNREVFDEYISILMDLHQKNPTGGYAAKALHVSERSRARGLLDSLAETRYNLREGVDEKLLERERALQREISAKASLKLSVENKKLAGELDNEINNLTIQLNQIEAQIRTASPNYAALIRPQPLTATEIQQRVLDSETILLSYHLGKEKSWLWAVTPDRILSYQLPPQLEIEAVARRVRDLQISAPTDAAALAKYNDEARKLSQKILGPVAHNLGQKRLAVAADGILQYLPFASLPDPLTNQPLIVHHEIVSLPSVSVLSEIRREFSNRPLAPKTIAVWADPVFRVSDSRVARTKIEPRSDEVPVIETAENSPLQTSLRTLREGLPRLHFSRDEAEAISSLTPAKSQMIAMGFRASLDELKQSDLSRYRILHFATHGLLNNEHPELSGLVMSLVDEKGKPQEGFWRLHEIYNLKLNAELVVLSACQTALGKEIKGEGLMGLTRGFMYAGTPRVVASLWQVDDVATSELMKRFYRGRLQHGLRPAAALRAAQLEMLAKKQWTHPFYWGAFTLQGEWK